MPYGTPVGECAKCGKKRFRSKKAARNYARSAFPKDRVQIYMCGGYYHFGHGDRHPRRKNRKKV